MEMEKASEDEFFIKKRELDELFDSKYALNVNLWRGKKKDQKGTSPLYPILKAFKLSNGKIRKPDIDTYSKGGVSLFDVLGVPVHNWDYYRIPKGVRIPPGLVITKDAYNNNYNATHYSIRPHWDMPVSKFCMLLDELTKELIYEN